MKKSTIVKSSVLGFVGLSFACALTLASINFKYEPKAPPIAPNYLLSGEFAETSGIFDYYDIGNNEYAVALNETSRKTYSGAIEIPSTHEDSQTHTVKNVTGIWHNAFYCNPATTVTFQAPSHIKTIDFEAFLYSGISSITIPYTVNTIGDAAFYHCDNLTTVNFANSSQESTGSATSCYCDENGVPYGGGGGGGTIHYSSLTTIPSFCFFRCEKLTTVTLPAAIQEICEEAFNGCYLLNSPFYFQNIKKIRARAFQGCAALRKVYISSSLFSDSVGIEPHAFNFCSIAPSPDNLDIVFCANQGDITNWTNSHPNWGWYNDKLNPVGNSYTYRREDGSTYFSTDWNYTCDSNGDVTITKYNGPAPSAATGYFISVPNSMPTPNNNRVVRIKRDAFDETVRIALRRLYLPRTIVAIENNMFNIWQENGQHVKALNNNHFNWNNAHGYSNLCVVADNNQCAIDRQLELDSRSSEIVKRIDLSGLTNLEFIGFRAFSGIGGNTTKTTIQKLRLPAKIRAVGDEAFGIFSFNMLPGIDELTWEYDTNSILEVIGTDAFYGVGQNSGEVKGNSKWRAHTASTIIFPKTFKYFSVLGSDKQRYKTQASHPFDFENFQTNKYQRPAHAFAGCSLLGKVIFKGAADSPNLVIPLQTFVYNESLRTIIFEERPGHEITFHTQQSGQNYAQESIGGNSGRGGNDFRGEPFLQTLVLPNKETKLRFQKMAFHANSRAAIYLSGSYGNANMVSDASGDDDAWITKNGTTNTNGTTKTFQNNDYKLATQWKTIGDESYFESKDDKQKYWGYNFTTSLVTNSTNDKSVGTYSIDQQIPVYENVHYKDLVDYKNTPSDTSDDITVEVGAGNTIEYFEDEDSFCSFVCGTVGGNNVATMTNYLYSIYDKTDSKYYKTNDEKETAHVPQTVTITVGETSTTYTVNKIGNSAFSACFCDGKDLESPLNVGDFKDLKYIELPNTIKSIGDYAFIRAYGVTTISSYSGNDDATEGMPSSLEHIGKNAFLFSSIKKVLKIPNACKFYENCVTLPTGIINDVDDAERTPAQPDDRVCSTFSSANDLRKITFIKNGVESSSSDYYETSTYTPSASGEADYTCALYSKNDNGLAFNKNRLLIVLNRDNADAKKVSAELVDSEVVSRDGNPAGLKFNGKFRENSFLFGAFKMGYWILELTVGNPTINPSTSKPYPQPLISGIGTRSSNNSTLKTKYVYLGQTGYHYTDTNASKDTKCDLDTISGNVLSLPQFAMNGCEKLTKVELPIQSGGVIPEGVFASVTNANTIYYVEGNTPTLHELDMTDCLYSEIGANVFENNTSIQDLTAPGVSDFTVGSSAFGSCTGLQSVDFSTVTDNLTLDSNAFSGCTNLTTVNFGSLSGSLTIGAEAFKGCTKLNTITFGNVTGDVTIDVNAFESCGNGSIALDFTNVAGTLTIKGGAFKSSKVSSITWPSSSTCDVIIENALVVSNTSYGAFHNCDSLTSVTIPSNLSGDLGSYAFYDCDGLTTVTFSSDFAGKIGNYSFESCEALATVTTDGSPSPVTNIGEGAFKSCTNLTAFDFAKFTSLTTISKQAFKSAGTLMSSGNVVLPTSVTTIGEEAFSASSIVTMKIQSSSINLGKKAFASCASLTAVRFTNSSCLWTSYSDGVFNNCGELRELQLPTNFNIGMPVNDTYYNGTTKFFIQNDTNVNLYTYTKYEAGVTVSTNGWRKTEAQIEKPTVYFAETISDLLTAGVINNDPDNPGITASASSLHFWMLDGDEAVYLGYVTAYNGSVVTFSSGHTLDSGGFH